ncbi:MAG: efflux RND transporter periplasmic adaptor subunit [Cyanobium sp. M30B3]|nr:MAG: efflux RND transporter periplasmic adaptor subunit [Cyanobium sp. M30B3]
MLLLAGVGASRLLLQPRTPAASAPPAAPEPRPIEAVAALGRLDPRGEIRRVAAPISGIGGSPRLTRLLVREGQSVTAGQLLAQFDTAPSLLAQQRLLQARISNLDSRLSLQRRDIERYRRLARSGAIASADLDGRETELLALQGELLEARAELDKTEAELELTDLRAPIAGTVLRLHAREGERPGDQGVLELGASHRMEALVEVYESDIARVRPGQAVTLTSEHGGFEGNLQGQVLRISPQVRQREVLATDPTQDADARIVEVRVGLEPESAQRVRALSGLKVIARFQP